MARAIASHGLHVIEVGVAPQRHTATASNILSMRWQRRLLPLLVAASPSTTPCASDWRPLAPCLVPWRRQRPMAERAGRPIPHLHVVHIATSNLMLFVPRMLLPHAVGAQ